MLPADNVPRSLEQYLGFVGSAPESSNRIDKNNASQNLFCHLLLARFSFHKDSIRPLSLHDIKETSCKITLRYRNSTETKKAHNTCTGEYLTQELTTFPSGSKSNKQIKKK